MKGVILFCLILAACAAKPTKRLSPMPPPVMGEAYDAELKNFTYPRPVDYFQFTSQGQPLSMAYELAEPERPNGRTVLLLHGKNFSANYWEPTIQFLVENGFRVIAPDQIGFGKSSKPANYQFTLQQLAVNTSRLLESLKVEKVTVVGHSMGGMLATRFALSFPEKSEKLVLVNPLGLEDWQRKVPYRTVDENYQAELKVTPESIKEYMRNSYFDGKWKAEYEPLVKILSGFTRHPDYPKVAWSAALTSDMLFTQPVLYEFQDLKLPTLLVIGQKDRSALGKANASAAQRASLGDYPKLGKLAAKAIPKAKLVEIPSAGHVPQVEAFSEYKAALLDFI